MLIIIYINSSVFFQGEVNLWAIGGGAVNSSTHKFLTVSITTTIFFTVVGGGCSPVLPLKSSATDPVYIEVESLVYRIFRRSFTALLSLFSLSSRAKVPNIVYIVN
jgi:hypothetical protein